MQMVDHCQIVALHVPHEAAHAGIALAEAEIVGRAGLGRLARRPVPAAAVLEVNDVDRMAGDDRSCGLKAEIVHATQALLEDLRAHDRRAHGEDDAAVEALHGSAEEGKIALAARPIAAPLNIGWVAMMS